MPPGLSRGWAWGLVPPLTSANGPRQAPTSLPRPLASLTVPRTRADNGADGNDRRLRVSDEPGISFVQIREPCQIDLASRGSWVRVPSSPRVLSQLQHLPWSKVGLKKNPKVFSPRWNAINTLRRARDRCLPRNGHVGQSHGDHAAGQLRRCGRRRNGRRRRGRCGRGGSLRSNSSH